jgi:hypothetical protein
MKIPDNGTIFTAVAPEGNSSRSTGGSIGCNEGGGIGLAYEE